MQTQRISNAQKFIQNSCFIADWQLLDEAVPFLGGQIGDIIAAFLCRKLVHIVNFFIQCHIRK